MDRSPRRCCALVVAGLFLCLYAMDTVAQITEPLEPGTGVPEQPPALPPTPKPRFDAKDYLTGTWGGLRNTLAEEGVEITGGYAMEYMGNPVGGRSQGNTYVHNVLLQLDLDLEKLIGLPKSAFRVMGSQRSGESLSQEHIGNAFSVQQLFGGGETYRLVEVQIYHRLLDDRLNLTYGRLSATDDFMTSPLYCQFVNNAFCGQPPAPFFNLPDGITAYPVATWGARARYEPTPESYFQVGVYDGDPEHGGNNPHGANFALGDNGTLVLAEAGYRPNHGLLGHPGAYKLGAYYHSGDFQDVATDVNGNNRLVTGLSGKVHSGNSGYYMLVDQVLYREAPRSDQGLSGFFVFTLAPEKSRNTLPYFYSIGLVYEGLIPSRPKDKTAFGVTTGWFSDAIRDAQRDAALERQSTETVIELNHQIQFTPYFYVRPDIQYVVNPNGLGSIDNALVLGFEAGGTF